MYVAIRVSLMPAVVPVVPAVPVPAVAGASAVVAVRHWVGVVTVVAAAHESDRYRRAGATQRCSPRRAAPFRAVPSGARQCRAVPDVTRFRAMARRHRRRALGGVVALVLCARVRTGACPERARNVSWRRWAYSRDLGRRCRGRSGGGGNPSSPRCRAAVTPSAGAHAGARTHVPARARTAARRAVRIPVCGTARRAVRVPAGETVRRTVPAPAGAVARGPFGYGSAR